VKHEKIYQQETLQINGEHVIIEGPVSEQAFQGLIMDEQLTAFRPPKEQLKALKEIATLTEARVFIVTNKNQLIGYVTYLHPDPIERWSMYPKENILELGAIEISPDYRGNKLGSKMIRLSMQDPHMEKYIVISTEYYWHWDLNYSKLSVWDYRKVMEKMMKAGDLYPASTNEPEILAHPANCLMVRIGNDVLEKDIELFDKLRFL